MIIVLFIYNSSTTIYKSHIYVEESLAAVADLLGTDVAETVSFFKGFATSISIQNQDLLQKRHRKPVPKRHAWLQRMPGLL
jgi:hypothetical protein